MFSHNRPHCSAMDAPAYRHPIDRFYATLGTLCAQTERRVSSNSSHPLAPAPRGLVRAPSQRGTVRLAPGKIASPSSPPSRGCAPLRGRVHADAQSCFQTASPPTACSQPPDFSPMGEAKPPAKSPASGSSIPRPARAAGVLKAPLKTPEFSRKWGCFQEAPVGGGPSPPPSLNAVGSPRHLSRGGGTFRAPAIIRLAGRNFSIGLEFFGKLALCPGNGGCLRKTWSVATPPRDFFLVVTGIWLSGSFSFQGVFSKIAPERSFPELKVSKSFSNFPGKFPGNPDFWAATPQFFPGSDRPGQFHALLPVLASRREINFCCKFLWRHK